MSVDRRPQLRRAVVLAIAAGLCVSAAIGIFAILSALR